MKFLKNKKKPKILLITPVFPDTTGYGLAMRAGVLLESLANYADVHLLIVPIHGPDKKRLPETMQRFCKACKVMPISKIERVKRRLKNALQEVKNTPMLPYATLFASPNLHQAVAQAFTNLSFDILYVFRLYMAPLIDACAQFNTIKKYALDLDDIESLTNKRFAERYRLNGAHAEANHATKMAKLYSEYERTFIPEFDAISVCSEKDQAKIQQAFPGKEIYVLPNVVRIPQQISPPKNGGVFNILFVGNLNYYPNQDALAFFIETIFPLLKSRTKRPIRFTIVGSGNWPGIKKYRGTEDCYYAGFVDNLAPYYQAASLVVVPLRAGGGTRIKILEAFSFKRPVVTTGIGVEGIEARHEKHILIADTAKGFAEQCCRIIENTEFAKTLTENAFGLLQKNYSMITFNKCLYKMLHI